MSPLRALLLWWQCVKRGGHAFDELGDCTVCSAKQSDPSLGDLIAEGQSGIDNNSRGQR